MHSDNLDSPVSFMLHSSSKKKSDIAVRQRYKASLFHAGVVKVCLTVFGVEFP